MGALCKEFAEMSCGLLDRVRCGDADAVEAKRARFLCERSFQVVARQKSRST
jgi:hypothetical protein